MQISRLRVGNEDFLVSSMIERCPKSMMLRELVKNALEAAGNAVEGGRRVEIGPLAVDGVRKLAIWNTGPGMDADQLYRMCDIASSIGKANGLDQNFGMGAKVASLPSNTHGIRYRSCKAGRVQQVVMGKRNDVYGRLHQTGPDGATADVLDVTAQAAEERDLEIDWTEVVLLGNRPDQDTAANPYDGSPNMQPGWIAEELYARFHTLPADIDLILKDGCNIIGGDRPFVPIGGRTAAFAKYEAVAAERGIKVHYYFDAPDPNAPGRLLSARNALQPARSYVALIHRGEFYDVRPPHAWLHEAPVFGLPFGARYFTVHIELPDDFPLLPDGYRQFLRHKHNLQHNLSAREFAPIVLRSRPAWLLELLRNFAPDARHTAPLHDEMKSLFKSLQIRRRWWPTGDGKHHERKPGEPGGEPEYEVAPQIVPLRDETDIRERGMEGKAARFYPETHQLFVNSAYPGFAAFSAKLEQEYATHADQELVRRTALTTTEQILIRQMCRKLVFGLGKRGTWHQWEVDQACSMYSLTLAADDNGAFYGEALEAMAAALGAPESRAPDPRIEQARQKFAAAMEEFLAVAPRHKGAAPVEFSMRLG
jgi:hypothetical protein